MRAIKTRDLFKLSKIIKKMDIKSDIKALTQDITGLSEDEKAKANQNLQVDIAMLIIENIGSAENEIYGFLADLTGSTVESIQDMDLGEFIELIKDIFTQEGIGDFLSTALK